MAKKLQLRRGTTTQHNSFTGAEGEVTVDTTKDSLVVHDGSTQGGHPIAKSSDIAGYAALTGATFTGDVLIDNAQTLRLGEADGSGSNFTAIKAQAQSADITLTLPAVAPTANQVLKADGSTPTNLTWASDVALTLIDEDDFSSDSATAVPSQQSTKAYIAATSQPLDADLTSLAGCQSGAAGAIAALTQTEVEILDGATLSTTELNYVDGVTSAIQTQLNAKGVGDAVLANDQNWTGSQRGAINALTSASTITIDMNAGNNHSVTLGHNTTFANPTNQTAGQAGSIFITQDGTGSRTAAWGANFLWKGGTVPTLSTAAASVDRIDYIILASTKIHAVATLDIKAAS